jgi:tight adherence protein C
VDAQQLQGVFNLAAVVLLSGAGIAGAVLLTGELRGRAQRGARLQGAPGLGPAERNGGGGLAGYLVAGMTRLGQQAAVKDPTKVSDIRMRLTRAGFFRRDAPILYLGARAAALVVATVATIAVLPFALGGKSGNMAIIVAAVFAVAAILGPDRVLAMRQKAREREYADGFPDLLDLLVASVEAGLSLDAGVSRVTEEMARPYPNLTIHLRLLTLELRAGKSRKEAWLAFADRLGIDDARALATMLRQAEEMGTSLGETLSVFSNDMRSKRMLRAEEQALALPAKLTVPLIIFIFPCLLGALLLPAIWRLKQSFSGG